jgi:hypothetical protein
MLIGKLTKVVRTAMMRRLFAAAMRMNRFAELTVKEIDRNRKRG